MRRSKQEIPIEESIAILQKGKVAVWAVSGDDGYPYAVPVNYVYSDNSIYIHSARKGHKLDAIIRNPKCSICVIDKDDIVPEKFTSYFRSVIAFGKAEILSDENDIIEALRHLSAKYSPGIDPTAEINKFLNSVAVIRIRLEKITGKEAIELVHERHNTVVR